MTMARVEVCDIKFDVDYSPYWVTDPLGTGNSPDEVEITLENVYLDNLLIDVQAVLSDYVLGCIEHEIAAMEYTA